MAVVMRRAAGVRAAGASRASTVRVSCHKGALEQVQVAAAGVLAAALIASPANAGVVLVQPELKKVFQSDAPAPAPVKKAYVGLQGLSLPQAPEKNAAAAKAAPAPKPETSSQGSDIDPRSVALPGAVLLVAGGFFAASKIDEDFGDFAYKAMIKPSDETGAGYEPVLKTEGGPSFGKAGTKKVQKKKK